MSRFPDIFREDRRGDVPLYADIGLDLLLEEKRLREALGRNGLDYVQRNYTWSQIIRKYEIMFNSLG